MLEKSMHISESDSKDGFECLKIRAHHLCCIQGFQGYGYSPAFVANMRAVISDIHVSPSRLIKLVSECDVICISCPGKKECSAQQSALAHRIRNMDLVVMDKLKIKEGTIINADEAFRLISSLNNPFDIEDICGTCKWRQKCLWYMQVEI